jgi:hypothetical protein
MTLELRSTAFEEGEMIPSEHTCDGEDVSPPLAWTGVPEGTESLAVVMDDIDSVKGIWSHWLVYRIPSEMNALVQRIPPSKTLPVGGVQGQNDFDAMGYGGPCPSDGKEHRYVVRLYALDGDVELEPGATREALLADIEGHVIEQAELMGRYKRLKDR